MDKEPDERMAPALQTNDREAAGSFVTNLKHPCSPCHNDEQDEDTLIQVNGVVSSHIANEVNNRVKTHHYYSKYAFDSVAKPFSYGNCGDNGSIILPISDAIVTTSKQQISKNQGNFGGGDGTFVVSRTRCGEKKTAKSYNITSNKTAQSFTSYTISETASQSKKFNDAVLKDFSSKDSLLQTAISFSGSDSTNCKSSSFPVFKTGPNIMPTVNVDKHESINPQIIHTTSITTSPLAFAHLSELEHEANGTSGDRHSVNPVHHYCESKNERTLISSIKSTVSGYTKNSNFKQEKFACGSINMCADKPDSKTSLSDPVMNESENSDKNLCFENISSVEHCALPLTTACINSGPDHLETAKSINNLKTVFSTSTYSCLISTSVKRNGAHGLKDVTCYSSSQFKNEDLSLVSINSLSTTKQDLKLSQACLPSTTYTTPVYNLNQSIPTHCIQSSTASISTKNSTNFSDTVIEAKKQLSVSDIKSSSYEIVTKLELKQFHPPLLLQKNNLLPDRHCLTNVENGLVVCAKPIDVPHIDCILKSQHDEVVKRNQLLQNQLSYLQSKVNQLQAISIVSHGRKNLQNWKTYKQSNKSFSSESKKNFVYSKPVFDVATKTEKETGSEQKISNFLDFESEKSFMHFQKNSSVSAEKIGVFKKEILSSIRRLDPDLTESSSDEEVDNFKKSLCISDNPSSHFSNSAVPIHKTSLWRLAHDRVSIAHRWTWLKAQVTGLDYKIKQHEDLIQQLRATKTEVILDYPNVSTVFPQSFDKHDSTKQSGATHACSVNNNNFASSFFSTSSHDNQQTTEVTQPTVTSGSLMTLSTTTICARARPLKHRLRNRRVFRISKMGVLDSKKLKPAIVPSDCYIMQLEQQQHTPFHRGDGKSRGVVNISMRSRAAMHDHSYHKNLSTFEDIQLSSRLNAVLFTNNKHFTAKLRKSERRSSKSKKKQKEAKQRNDRLFEKIKSRPKSATVVLERADKLIRSVSALQRNTSFDDRTTVLDLKKRRSTTSLSEYNKRNRITSFDSDVESHRSESGTPVFDSSASYYNNPQYQAVLRRKRANDQAYDINNIVIPHGLTSTRIEKLQYKEILTPGWRITKIEPLHASIGNLDEEKEDVSEELFKSRHDRHEILEKKKYMNYLEMNMNKRTGARSMSRANLPLDDPPSLFSSPLRSSPTSPFPPGDITAPTSPENFTPVMLRSRRSSSEHSLHSNTSCQPVTDRIRLHDSLSSDDGILRKLQRENSTFELWTQRTFPLAEPDIDELKSDPVVCIKKLPKELESNQVFHPISGQDVPSPLLSKQKSLSRSDSSPSLKRSRADSHTSTLSRDDERLSDDSVSSSRSLKRVHSKAIDSIPSSFTSVPNSAAPSLHSPRKRHKPTHKKDFYYYSEMDSSSDSDDDGVQSNVSSNKSLNFAVVRSEHFRSRESTPKPHASGDERTSPNQKPPLLLKVKKKYLHP